VNPATDSTEAAIAVAEDRLARLDAQAEAMRAVLVRLLQDVVLAERRLEDGQEAAQLVVEANEKLVEATLDNQAKAEVALDALKQAEQSAVLDALTQLPNRRMLIDRFAQAMANARRGGDTRFALLFVDLDNFKQLNDLHGHACGDAVLRLAAARLASAVREVDTVSRHGGDEFVVLLAALHHPRDAQAVAEKLIAAIGAPARLAGHVVRITASVGIALYPDDGEDVETLIARADAAMYRSKRLGAGGIAFYGQASSAIVVPAAQPVSPAAAARPGAAAAPADPHGRAADADRIKARLREANEKLVLAALSAQELLAAAERARQRQNVFVAAVADELRNPAAPIRIASAMLGRGPSQDLPLLPRVQSIVEQQMTQMSRLVGSLVDGSAIAGGGLTLDRRWVDLAEVIERAVASHRPRMKERNQRFELHRPAGALGVQGDAALLEQVVGNLLDNASTHTHEGGSISLSVIVDADNLTLTVSDNGFGITAQALPDVFEPFVQNTLALGFEDIGPGIGLTVTRSLVQAHGGRIAAHSPGVNRGSRFVVTLPLVGDAPIATDAAAAKPDADAKP
jgi:diguanylate cyclase (GGDEF)-like protein